MTKFKTLINFKDGTSMYYRDHKEAFENAKSKAIQQTRQTIPYRRETNNDSKQTIDGHRYTD